MINIVKAGVAEHFAHFFHVPLLYIVGMRIGKVKKSFAEMSDDGVFVQKFLIVELLRQHFLFSGTADDCALVGKRQFFLFNERACLAKLSCFLNLVHVEQHYSAVDIVWVYQKFAVMVACRSVFDVAYVDIVQKRDIAIKHNIRVKI